MGLAIKVKMLLLTKGISLTELGKRLDPPTSAQNLNGKLTRDNLSEKDLHAIAKACGVKFEGSFIFDDGSKL